MNEMTGDPNQETRPSLFGYDSYPSRTIEPIDWGRLTINPPPIPPIPMVPPGSYNSLNFGHYNQASLGNFSFCSSQTPHPAQFPFTTSHGNAIYTQQPATYTSSFRCKRKTDSPSLQSKKQHITEEKMAEHMSKLHISSEMATTSKESEVDRTKRLYMCEEMRKLQSDTIIPQSLLSQIQRPCTALVLWQPPRRLVPSANNLGEVDNGNNNEEAVPDNNIIADEEFIENDANMDLDQV